MGTLEYADVWDCRWGFSHISSPHHSILTNPLCADLTYNMVAFSEIMQMIWKRLNDHGKNWRHVYKAMVLLEYLIKTGSEKVEKRGDRRKFYQNSYFSRLPSNAKKTFSPFRPWRISSLLRTTRTRDSTWGRKPRPWWLCWRTTSGWRTRGRELWRRRKDLLSPLRVSLRVLPGLDWSHSPMFTGYHPDHQGSPVGSPGDEYQQRLKPDIELARWVWATEPQPRSEDKIQLGDNKNMIYREPILNNSSNSIPDPFAEIRFQPITLYKLFLILLLKLY